MVWLPPPIRASPPLVVEMTTWWAVLQMIGSMPKELVLKNTELFAKEVMPAVKKIWAGEWKDRWSPQPLPERAVPGASVAN